MVDPKSGKYDLLPHVAPGNIESFTGRLYDNVKLVGEENLISGKFVFNVGDIVYGKINPQLGKYVFARFSGLTSADAYVLNAKNGIVQKFLYAVIQTRDFYDYSVSVSKRSGMPKINRDELNAYSYWAPSESEQLKIGEYLLTLDHLITLHQRQPFLHSPPDISLIVQLTPPFYTFSWEQRKFSDITFPAGEKNKDNLPLESYSITNEHGFVPQDEKFENGGTMREADKRMYYIVSPNSFAYNPARINVGSIGYQNVGKNVIVSSLYEVFKTSEDVDDRLLWHWFKSPDFQKLIMQLQEGGVRLYFYYDKLCMGEVSLPSLEEQRKIGKLFDTLDNLITLHQRQTIVYAVIRSIRKVILAERQYFAPPMVRKSP